MRKAGLRTLAVETGSGNVFADLGLPNPEEHQVKADLASRIDDIVRHRKLTQAKAAAVMGLKQPDVSRYCLTPILPGCDMDLITGDTPQDRRAPPARIRDHLRLPLLPAPHLCLALRLFEHQQSAACRFCECVRGPTLSIGGLLLCTCRMLLVPLSASHLSGGSPGISVPGVARSITSFRWVIPRIPLMPPMDSIKTRSVSSA